MIGVLLIMIALPDYVMASGGEEMDYCLFLETNVGYEISLNYFEYDIYGDFTKDSQEGRNLYFRLNEQMVKSQFQPTTQTEWADNMINEHIVDISPDLKWVITRQYNCSAGSIYTEKLYHDNVLLDTREGDLSLNIGNYTLQKILGAERYELMPDHRMEQLENLIQKIWDKSPGYYCNALYSFDEYGKLLAIAGDDNQCISIYRTEDFELLYQITLPHADNTWPLEISQIVGNEEKGIVLLSNGGNTYQVSYPDGEMTKIGEFMFSTTYSPDMKYRAYCTGNVILPDNPEAEARFKEIVEAYETLGDAEK